MYKAVINNSYEKEFNDIDEILMFLYYHDEVSNIEVYEYDERRDSYVLIDINNYLN